MTRFFAARDDGLPIVIATCPECSARFRIPDDKMRPGGVNVRCSRCKQVFAAGAQDDLGAPMGTPMPLPTPLPTPMPSLPSLRGSASAAFSEMAGMGADHTAAISFDDAQRAASQNLSMGLPQALGDLGPPPIAGRQGAGAEFDPGPPSGGAFDIGPPPGPPPGGDYGGFGGVAPRVGSGPGPAPGATSGAIGVDRGASISLADGSGRAPGAAPAPVAVSRTRSTSPEMGAASAHQPLPTRSSVGMLLFLTLLTFNAVCAYVLYKNDWRADLRRAGDMFRVALDAGEEVMLPVAKPPVPRLQLAGVRARTLDNDEGSTILIVDGLAKNSGDVAVRDVLIAGRLLDAQADGSVIRKATAPATGRLPPDILRTVRGLSDVQRAYKVMARGKDADDTLLPGAEAAFTVVFPDLPGDFVQAKERYRFEVQIGAYEEAIDPGGASADKPAGGGAAGDSDDTEDSGISAPVEPAEEFIGPPAPG